MNGLTVKELMIPLRDYPAVDPNATLYDAIMSLEESQRHLPGRRCKHRMILALEKDGGLAGKVEEWNLVVSLEDGYRKSRDHGDTGTPGSGSAEKFLKMTMSRQGLWQEHLSRICREAENIKVREVMQPLVEGEHILESAALDLAVQRFLRGEFQALLVTAPRGVTGVLRFSDVVDLICEQIRSCEIERVR